MKVKASTLRRFHAVLKDQGIHENRQDLVSQETDGKYESSKDLTESQALAIIARVSPNQKNPPKDSADQQRKKIIGLLRNVDSLGFVTEKGKADMTKIYAFIEKRGYLGKPLNKYSNFELPKLVTQVAQICKSYEGQ